MIASDPKLGRRVLASHAGFSLGAAAVVALLAPELLLLRAPQYLAALSSLFWSVLAGEALGLIHAWWSLRRHRYLLRALTLGSGAVEPFQVEALSRELWRVTVGWVAPAVVALGLVASVLRPPTIDLTTGISLGLMGIVIVATATLPFYVVLRASFARALELVSPHITREVVREAARHRVPRRRLARQLIAAVATPVAFVSLGAALIANAHLRRADERARYETARALARSAFEAGPGVVQGAGLADAREQAELLGFNSSISAFPHEYSVTRGDEGISVLTTPLDEGSATLRFSGSTVSVLSVRSLVVALLAVGIAAGLGIALARTLRRDLRVATKGVRELTAGALSTGTRYVRRARFRAVGRLALAIERLAVRFRVFARAQKRAIEAREAATRMRGLFFASVSHDLKSPLNAILGFTEVVRQTEDLSPGQLESLNLIDRSGRELLALIETILDAARVEAGQLDLVRDNITIPDLFEQSIEKGRDLGGHADIAVVGEIPGHLPKLQIDRVRITRALATFVGHAMRTAEESPIRLRATADDHDVVDIEVSVPSQRFSAAQLESLLDPSGSPGTAEHRGLALGLSLARNVIGFHQGTVRVEDRGAKGTAFCVHLPTGAEFTNPLLRVPVIRPSRPPRQ